MPEMNNFKSGNNIYEVADSKARGVSLTWAQYQALSYEEQHNGTAYYITDMDAIYPVDHELNANSRNAVANDIVTPHILAMENVLGAKNLLDIKSKDEYLYGVTATYNDDGSITLNGTPTGHNCVINLYCDVQPVSVGRVFSGVSGGSVSTYYINILYSDNSWDNTLADGEATCIKTLPITRYSIVIIDGVRVDNLTIYPMIRPAGTDPTYVPYAMPNSELTERVMIVDVLIDTVTLTAGETANLTISSVVPSGYIPVSVSYVSDNNYGLCYSMFTHFVNDNWFLLFQNTTNSSVTLRGHAKISMLKYSI